MTLDGVNIAVQTKPVVVPRELRGDVGTRNASPVECHPQPAKDSAGNFATAVSFTVTINPPETTIPSWVKNVAEFWCQDKIDDGSFVEAIQYLIDNGIIVVPATQESFGGSQEIPQWVKNNACWWSDGSITDLDFALGLEYLVKQGIIRV